MDQIVVDCGPVGIGTGRGGRRGGPARAPGRRGGHRRRVGRTCSAPSATRCCAASVPGCPVSSSGAVGRTGRPEVFPARTGQYHAAVAPGTELAELAREAAGCTRCPLAAGRTQVVFGVGDPAPTSCSSARPRGATRTCRASRSSAARASCSTGCSPRRSASTGPPSTSPTWSSAGPRTTATREPEEIAACRPYLDAQLDLIGPTVVVTLGELRHQAAPRHRPGHHPGAGQVLPDGRRTSWSPPTTRRPPCDPGGWWWPRCGPTWSGPSSCWAGHVSRPAAGGDVAARRADPGHHLCGPDPAAGRSGGPAVRARGRAVAGR